MPTSPYIFDATEKNFDALVLDNSGKGAVLVNYWASYAGPCLKLWPVLEKLANEYQGRFLLVNVNTEKQPALAKRYGINSVPTIKVFRHRQIVDSMYGAESETGVRRLIEQYIARESDAVLREAIKIYEKGDIEGAMEKLREASEADSFNLRIPLTLAKIFMRNQQFEHAEELIQALPEEVRNDTEVERMTAHLAFIRASQAAPDHATLEQRITTNGSDLEARYQLAALALVNDDFEHAILQLLNILEQDRQYEEGIARKGLGAIFAMLDSEHELVQKYRKQMFNLIY